MPRIARRFRHSARRRARAPLLRHILYGAAGGAVGTYIMGPVMSAAYRLQPPQPAEGQSQEPATEKLARKALEPFGVSVQGERKKRLGNAVHWGYGLTWGALFGALHHRLPWMGRFLGLGFGLGLFLLGDEVLVPALRLAPPPQKVPLRIHAGALAAHLAYSAGTVGSYRLLRRALA